MLESTSVTELITMYLLAGCWPEWPISLYPHMMTQTKILTYRLYYKPECLSGTYWLTWSRKSDLSHKDIIQSWSQVTCMSSTYASILLLISATTKNIWGRNFCIVQRLIYFKTCMISANCTCTLHLLRKTICG